MKMKVMEMKEVMEMEIKIVHFVKYIPPLTMISFNMPQMRIKVMVLENYKQIMDLHLVILLVVVLVLVVLVLMVLLLLLLQNHLMVLMVYPLKVKIKHKNNKNNNNN